MSSVKWPLLAVAALVALVPAPAGAQKNKDTLRTALYQPTNLLDEIHHPNPDSALLQRPLFDNLIDYDAQTKKIVPLLAESWRQIDDKTLEFKLRRDVKFHDGSPMTADDVVGIFDYVADPKVNFMFKDNRFGWIDGTEKIDAYTVRIRSKEVKSDILSRLAVSGPIQPAKVRAALADKADFGKRPVGTGPYKAVEFDPGKRAVLVRNDDYKHGGTTRPVPQIARVEASFIGDSQTQVARLIVGDQDMVYSVDYEQAKSLLSNPDLRVAVTPGLSFSYIFFDAADRSGVKFFKDIRVREALLRAIDRDSLRKALLPPEIAKTKPLGSMCHPWLYGCTDSTVALPAYDPALAKRMLAEAGYPDGFDVEISTWGTARRMAESVAGELRAIGVRASVSNSPMANYLKKRSDGKIQMAVSLWDNGGASNAQNTSDFFYLPGPRDYIEDKSITDWNDEAAQMLDDGKRFAIYKQIFDRVNAERLQMPIIELPAVIVHHKDLVMRSCRLKPEGFEFNCLSWAK